MSERRRYLSPPQVAEILGVGTTTVKRWVDEGRLPARKTAGGHRKILVADVQRLVHSGTWPCVNLALLASHAGVAAPDVPALNDHLYAALMTGDHARARTLVLEAHEGGLSAARLGDEVIAPVMARVGHGWETTELDVYQEHRGTQTCLTALQALKLKVTATNGADRPLAIGGGPEGDHYLLANLLVEIVLVEMGWRAVNIGPNTPLTSLARALVELRPRLMWFSCSYVADEERLVSELRSLYAEAERLDVAMTVGGRALLVPLRERILFTHHGDRLSDLVAFVQTLQPRADGEPGT